MKYRVGKKQKRVIIDENGYEVAICYKGKEEVAQQICDLLNEHGLVSKNESLHDVRVSCNTCKYKSEEHDKFCDSCFYHLKYEKDEALKQGQSLPIDSVMPCFEFSGIATKYNQGVAVDTDGIALSNDVLPHKAYTLEEGVKYTVKLYKA